jgi:hypothetical protein
MCIINLYIAMKFIIFLGSTVWSKDINSQHRLASSKQHVGPAGNVDLGKNPDSNTSRLKPPFGQQAARRPRGNC